MDRGLLINKNMKKINWGTSIVIAFGLFMTFILYFVIKAQTNPKYNNELVVEEYYKHDAHYGDEMTKLQNAQQLKELPVIIQSEKGIEIVFPNSFSPEKISGDMSLYRPSNKKLDFNLKVNLSGNSQLIPQSDFVDGLWDMTLSWNYEGKEFMLKKELYIN